MVVAQTSLNAFNEIRLNLSKRQEEILNFFRFYGNHTNLEVSLISKIPINSVTPRINELINMEDSPLEMKGKRVSVIDGKVVGKNAFIWGLVSCGTICKKGGCI